MTVAKFVGDVGVLEDRLSGLDSGPLVAEAEAVELNAQGTVTTLPSESVLTVEQLAELVVAEVDAASEAVVDSGVETSLVLASLVLTSDGVVVPEHATVIVETLPSAPMLTVEQTDCEAAEIGVLPEAGVPPEAVTEPVLAVGPEPVVEAEPEGTTSVPEAELREVLVDGIEAEPLAEAVDPVTGVAPVAVQGIVSVETLPLESVLTVVQIDSEGLLEEELKPVAEFETDPVVEAEAEPVAGAEPVPVSGIVTEPVAVVKAEPVAGVEAGPVADPGELVPGMDPAAHGIVTVTSLLSKAVLIVKQEEAPEAGTEFMTVLEAEAGELPEPENDVVSPEVDALTEEVALSDPGAEEDAVAGVVAIDEPQGTDTGTVMTLL